MPYNPLLTVNQEKALYNIIRVVGKDAYRRVKVDEFDIEISRPISQLTRSEAWKLIDYFTRNGLVMGEKNKPHRGDAAKGFIATVGVSCEKL